jgi:hypothetical protein
MKLSTAFARLGALWPRRNRRRRADPDPADMGTAFGLDSTITLIGPARRPEALGRHPEATWEQRIAKRTRRG